MKKTIITCIAFILWFSWANAQLYIEDDVLKVSKNAMLKVETNLVTKKVGTTAPVIRNWGVIAVTDNTDFDAATVYSGQGDLCMLGTSQQTLSTNGIPLKKLDVQNENNISLLNDLNIQGSLTLTKGHLDLGNFNLTLDDSITVSGGSSSSYIRVSGTGKLKTKVGSSPVTLPVGRNPYLPIVIDDGGDAEFTVGVANNVYSNPQTNTGQKTANVVSETWTIQASQAVSNVIVQIGWDAAEEETGFDRTQSMIGYWEHGVSTAWDASATNTTATGSDPYFQSRTVNFSTNLFYFGVGSSGSALPVELTYFTAQWQESGKTAQLSWQTAMEENNSHFEVERSHDGVNWEVIGQVLGRGTTFSLSEYGFLDSSPMPTRHQSLTVFYRLKQVDYNGQFEYSPIRTLNRKHKETPTFTVYPNPAAGNMINAHAADNYLIYSSTGHVVLRSYQTSKIDISSLTNGRYTIKNSNGQFAQFVKI